MDTWETSNSIKMILPILRPIPSLRTSWLEQGYLSNWGYYPLDPNYILGIWRPIGGMNLGKGILLWTYTFNIAIELYKTSAIGVGILWVPHPVVLDA